MQRERKIVDNYIDGLKQLAAIYDDKHLVDFVDDFINQQDPVKAFQKSVELAEMRKVPSSESPKTKAEIDAYFARRDS